MYDLFPFSLNTVVILLPESQSEALCIKSLNITEDSIKNQGCSLHGIALDFEGKGKGLVKISNIFSERETFGEGSVW